MGLPGRPVWEKEGPDDVLAVGGSSKRPGQLLSRLDHAADPAVCGILDVSIVLNKINSSNTVGSPCQEELQMRTLLKIWLFFYLSEVDQLTNRTISR